MGGFSKGAKGLWPEALAAVVLLVVTLSVLTRVEYTVLFKDMNPDDSYEMVVVLRDMGIPVKARDDDTILVPSEQAEQLRMQLAEQGYPKSGFNYELFTQGTGFGTTEYEKRMYEKFQKEVRIQDVLEIYDGVNQAVVTLAIPDIGEEILSQDGEPAAASVMLYLEPETELTDEQIESVVLLVASSVENLPPENVSITDNLLRRLY